MYNVGYHPNKGQNMVKQIIRNGSNMYVTGYSRLRGVEWSNSKDNAKVFRNYHDASTFCTRYADKNLGLYSGNYLIEPV